MSDLVLERGAGAIDQQAVLAIFEATAGETGEGLLKALTKALCETLGATHAFVAFALDEPATRVRVVASFNHGEFRDRWDYELEGNPCLIPYQGEPTLIPCDVHKDFAHKRSSGYEGFIGFPLSSRGHVLGHLAVYFDRQVDDVRVAISCAGIFAKRVEAEVHRMLAEFQTQSMLQALEQENRELWQQSRSDPLTGLSNRRAFLERAEVECRRSRRTCEPVGVLYIDLDHFKQVNDRFGHLVGDQVLQAASAVVRSTVRADTDLAARLGGEELAVLLPGADLQACHRIAESVRLGIETCVFTDSPDLRVTASIGIAVLCDADSCWESLLSRADMQLYRAKTAGRNRVEG